MVLKTFLLLIALIIIPRAVKEFDERETGKKPPGKT